MVRAYGGIDPGNQGALVLLSEDFEVLDAQTMPLLDVGKGKSHRWVLHLSAVQEILASWCHGHAPFVAIEQSRPMPKQGVSSVFRYGQSYGALLMALCCLGLAHEVVPPLDWQRATLRGIPGQGKARAILRAEQAVPALDLLPGRKRTPHDGLADACCMALYAAQLRGKKEAR